MTSEKHYISVRVQDGERVRKTLSDLGLLDGEYRIVSENGILYLPTVTDVSPEILHQHLEDVSLEVGRRHFETSVQGPRTLTEALEGQLPLDVLELLPRAYDLIGDIAVLEIPDELKQHSKLIGNAFHSIHRNFRTVLAKRGAVSGVTRVRGYEFLSGDDRTKTIHTEYGCRLAVDLEKAYFSPRLLEEHSRVAQLVEDGEVVVDMFCGVGPFAIHIARQKQARVVAIDVNPSAIELLKESITLNRLVGEIVPVVADAHDYAKSINVKADRVIMNHPSGASEFIPDACRILKPGGAIHYYDFVGSASPGITMTEKITHLIEHTGHTIREVSLVRRVRDSAPHEYQMVADIVIEE
jgi:tRNA (guanine37-N1)-methyltransferase